MIKILRTNSKNADFNKLVQLLNSDLAKRDGENHPLAQFNSIATIKCVVLAYYKQKPIGCGAMSAYDAQVMEIKRMYVVPEARGKRIGKQILSELENWAKESGSSRCILFTGSNQPEANNLYNKNGYKKIKQYGKLIEITDSLCFSKDL